MGSTCSTTKATDVENSQQPESPREKEKVEPVNTSTTIVQPITSTEPLNTSGEVQHTHNNETNNKDVLEEIEESPPEEKKAEVEKKEAEDEELNELIAEEMKKMDESDANNAGDVPKELDNIEEEFGDNKANINTTDESKDPIDAIGDIE